MDQVHRWPTVVAQRIAVDLAEVAGGKLVAVYLHGSAVLGGWVPGRSDVDVLIVAADDTDGGADAMAHVIVKAQPEWPSEQPPAPALETSIVTSAAASEPRPPWPFLRHVVTGPAVTALNARVVRPGKGPEAVAGDRDLLMHYAVCRAAGHALCGPPPRDLIGPIARADILAYLADELSWGLGNAPECYAVLNACRARLYLSDGAIVSKIAGGEAALQRGTGPDDVIVRALAQQRDARPDRHQADKPAAADAIAFVQATAALLRTSG